MTRSIKPSQTDNIYAYDGHGRRIKAIEAKDNVRPALSPYPMSIDANGTHYSMYNHAGKLLFKETIKDGPFYLTSIGGLAT